MQMNQQKVTTRLCKVLPEHLRGTVEVLWKHQLCCCCGEEEAAEELREEPAET